MPFCGWSEWPVCGCCRLEVLHVWLNRVRRHHMKCSSVVEFCETHGPCVARLTVISSRDGPFRPPTYSSVSWNCAHTQLVSYTYSVYSVRCNSSLVGSLVWWKQSSHFVSCQKRFINPNTYEVLSGSVCFWGKSK